VYRDATKEKNA